MELRDLLINKLKALYDIESVVIEGLADLSNAISSRKLKLILEECVEESKKQSKRLEDCFKLLSEKPDKLSSEAIRGLFKDALWVTQKIPEGELRDANLTAALSYIEHYQMAGYNSAIIWAEALDENDVADLLNMSFTEKESFDGKLQDLATTIVEKI